MNNITENPTQPNQQSFEAPSREAQLETRIAELLAQIEQMKLIATIDAALVKAGARNAIAARALINIDALKSDGLGGVEGLDKVIENLKRSDSYLFFTKDSAQIYGFTPVDGRAREIDAFAFGFGGIE